MAKDHRPRAELYDPAKSIISIMRADAPILWSGRRAAVLGTSSAVRGTPSAAATERWRVTQTVDSTGLRPSTTRRSACNVLDGSSKLRPGGR